MNINYNSVIFEQGTPIDGNPVGIYAQNTNNILFINVESTEIIDISNIPSIIHYGSLDRASISILHYLINDPKGDIKILYQRNIELHSTNFIFNTLSANISYNKNENSTNPSIRGTKAIIVSNNQEHYLTSIDNMLPEVNNMGLLLADSSMNFANFYNLNETSDQGNQYKADLMSKDSYVGNVSNQTIKQFINDNSNIIINTGISQPLSNNLNNIISFANSKLNQHLENTQPNFSCMNVAINGNKVAIMYPISQSEKTIINNQSLSNTEFSLYFVLAPSTNLFKYIISNCNTAVRTKIASTIRNIF